MEFIKRKEILKYKKELALAIIALDLITLFCSLGVFISSCFAVFLVIKFLQRQEEGKSNKLIIGMAYFMVIINGPFLILLTTFNYMLYLEARDKETNDIEEYTSSDLETEQKELKENNEFSKWISFEKSLIDKQISEANSSGCDFLQISTAGKVEGFINGNFHPIYRNVIPQIPHKYIEDTCKWIENQWKEISTDYTDEVVILSWR